MGVYSPSTQQLTPRTTPSSSPSPDYFPGITMGYGMFDNIDESALMGGEFLETTTMSSPHSSGTVTANNSPDLNILSDWHGQNNFGLFDLGTDTLLGVEPWNI